MKNFTLCALLLSSVSSAAFARPAGPILTRTESPGFTPPSFQIGKKCEIYFDKVVKTYSVGMLTSIESIPAIVQKPAIVLDLIGQASNGPFTTQNAPTDVPTTFWNAFQILPNDAVKTITLRASGSTVISTTNDAAIQLINFMDLMCK